GPRLGPVHPRGRPERVGPAARRRLERRRDVQAGLRRRGAAAAVLGARPARRPRPRVARRARPVRRRSARPLRPVVLLRAPVEAGGGDEAGADPRRVTPAASASTAAPPSRPPRGPPDEPRVAPLFVRTRGARDSCAFRAPRWRGSAARGRTPRPMTKPESRPDPAKKPTENSDDPERLLASMEQLLGRPFRDRALLKTA